MSFFKGLKFSISKNFTKPSISKDLTFTEGVNEFLTKELSNYKSYLEYGSGASTVFFSKYENLNIVAVESDAAYANQVKIAIGNNIRTQILHSGTGPTGLWGVPLFFKNSTSTGFKYVNTPWRNLGENYEPEIILVDGRYRVACALNILVRYANKKSFTILFDDYIGRDEYSIVSEYFKNSLQFVGGRMGIFKYNLEIIDDLLLNEIKNKLKLYLEEYV
jgi:hypothetical protein